MIHHYGIMISVILNNYKVLNNILVYTYIYPLQIYETLNERKYIFFRIALN